MPWRTTKDLDQFDAVAGALPRTDPVRNTLMLTAVDHLRIRGTHAFGDEDPVFGWWEAADSAVTGVLLRTPPWPMIVSAIPSEALESLVDIVLDMGCYNAERQLAEALAEQIHHRSGKAPDLGRQTRLYRLDRLIPPDPAPPGEVRVATPADRDLLVRWYEAFGDEVGESRSHADEITDDRLSYGGMLLWEDGGTVVCMAGRSRPQAGMVRIGPVYTPPAGRRRGYAAALTAEISRQSLELVAEVLLFTDLANPTSNAIYQRIGYRPIEDRVVFCLPDGAA
jgi:predicted GNAT family acetyltransferase